MSLLVFGKKYEYDIHHNEYYGTSRKLMNEKISSGKIIVKDMDVNGTDNLLKIFDIQIIIIFNSFSPIFLIVCYSPCFSSSNIAFTEGAFFVSFLILSSSALLFANRRLFSEERSAAFVF